MGSLEDKIAVDNPVRFIDAFVGFIDLQKIGFEPRLLNNINRIKGCNIKRGINVKVSTTFSG